MNDNIKDLSNDEIELAYQALPADEKTAIDSMAKKLETELKARHTGKTPLMFGRKQALEVLAKTGIWLIQNRQVA
jgi:hypothetical protein